MTLLSRILAWFYPEDCVSDRTLARLRAEYDAAAILPPVGTREWAKPEPATPALGHRGYVDPGVAR